MKHPRRRSPSIPTIWLIAEDNTGYFAFRMIIKRKNINANVRLRGVAAGISPLAAELEDVIKATLEEKLPRDCIIVLHDLDDAVQTYREAYKRIGVICQKYADDVTLLVANQEIEAWLLADDAYSRGTSSSTTLHPTEESIMTPIEDTLQRDRSKSGAKLCTTLFSVLNH